MREQVQAELCVVAEGLPALLADVGLLATVDALMLYEIGASAECLAALGALEGPLAAVDARVLKQREAAPEHFTTHAAHKWHLTAATEKEHVTLKMFKKYTGGHKPR